MSEYEFVAEEGIYVSRSIGWEGTRCLCKLKPQHVGDMVIYQEKYGCLHKSKCEATKDRHPYKLKSQPKETRSFIIGDTDVYINQDMSL